MLLSTFPPQTYPIAPPDNLISDILTVISLLAIAVWFVLFIIKKWEIVQIVSFIAAHGMLYFNVFVLRDNIVVPTSVGILVVSIIAFIIKLIITRSFKKLFCKQNIIYFILTGVLMGNLIVGYIFFLHLWTLLGDLQH